MNIEQTIDKLNLMKLYGMTEALEQQNKTANITELSFDERMGMMVDAEYTYRQNRKLSRYLTEARLRHSQACIEDIDYNPNRKIDKSVILQLSSCRWVKENHSIIITGKTGVGKSYLACALANQACRKGFRCIYRRAVRLFEELMLAHADGTYAKQLARFAKIDVLVIDDFALSPITDTNRRDLLEVLEDRDGLKSTIVTSQLEPENWHAFIGEPTTSDAICDRILHSAHHLMLKGPSRRKEQSPKRRSEN